MNPTPTTLPSLRQRIIGRGQGFGRRTTAWFGADANHVRVLGRSLLLAAAGVAAVKLCGALPVQVSWRLFSLPVWALFPTFALGAIVSLNLAIRVAAGVSGSTSAARTFALLLGYGVAAAVVSVAVVIASDWLAAAFGRGTGTELSGFWAAYPLDGPALAGQSLLVPALWPALAGVLPLAAALVAHATTHERTLVVQFVVGLVVVSFLAGAAVVQYRVFPYRQFFAPAFEAAKAHRERIAVTGNLFGMGGAHVSALAPGADASYERVVFDSQAPLRGNILWTETDFRRGGVVVHDPARAFAGYTLFTAARPGGAVLVDMDGTVVHRWYVPLAEAIPPAPGSDNRKHPEWLTEWRRVHLFPNGDLLVVFGCWGDLYGCGMIKLDRDSNVLWRYAEAVHHDLYVHDDGTIYTLLHHWRDTPGDARLAGLELPDRVLEDLIVQLSPDGRELRRIDLLDALVASPFRDMLQAALTPTLPDTELWDILHTNTVKLLSPGFAQHHDFAKPGQALVSIRTLDAIALVDMEAQQVVWANRGFWGGQHDPDPLENGRMLIFDNYGFRAAEMRSRVIEFDPATNAMYWTFDGRGQTTFFSGGRGSQQLLPNGNVLITETNRGRLFEVTRDKDIVWDYRSPYHGVYKKEPETEYIPVLGSGLRFPPEFIRFELAGAGAAQD